MPVPGTEKIRGAKIAQVAIILSLWGRAQRMRIGGKLWRAIAQSLIAILVLSALTVLCARLRLNLATACLLFMVVIVLLARMAELIAFIAAAVFAAVLLTYLAPPAAFFQVRDPSDTVAISAFLIASLTIGSLVFRVRSLADEALSSVNRKLVDAEERERSRIGRELHDDICQSIALLTIRLDYLAAGFPRLPAELVARMHELSKQMGKVSSSIHAVAHTLHSHTLEYLGLANSVSSFCAEFGDKQRVRIDFEVHDLPSNLPPDVSLALFRVLQEALQNSVRHSGVRQFEVELFENSHAVHLIVRDSGRGFDAKRLSGAGLGLISMRDRIKLVNGELLIKSRLQRGTTIHAKVPLVSTELTHRPDGRPPSATENKSVRRIYGIGKLVGVGWQGFL